MKKIGLTILKNIKKIENEDEKGKGRGYSEEKLQEVERSRPIFADHLIISICTCNITRDGVLADYKRKLP